MNYIEILALLKEVVDALGSDHNLVSRVNEVIQLLEDGKEIVMDVAQAVSDAEALVDKIFD